MHDRYTELAVGMSEVFLAGTALLPISLRGPRLPHSVYSCIALWVFKPNPDILVTSS
jgi:hypothetical protein